MQIHIPEHVATNPNPNPNPHPNPCKSTQHVPYTSEPTQSLRQITRRKKKVKKRKYTKPIPWTKKEIQAVIDGYEKYKQFSNPKPGSDGIWNHIKKDAIFSTILLNRTNNMISDKWRHLVRYNDDRIQHLLNKPYRTSNIKKRGTPTKKRKRVDDINSKTNSQSNTKKSTISERKTKPKVKRWENEEIAALVDGYEKYQHLKGVTCTPGIWAHIKRDEIFGKALKDRSNHDIRRKWRYLTPKQKLEKTNEMVIVPWSQKEIQAVIDGYTKYKKYKTAIRGQKGIWGHITNDAVLGQILKSRTASSICSKWIYLVKQNDSRIQHLL